VIRKFSDPPLRKCEKCGGKVEKLLSAPAIAFKGSGWYVTEHGNRKAGGEGSKSDPGKGGGSKGDVKGESDSGKEASPAPEAPSAKSAETAPKKDKKDDKGKRKS